jgi:hypothetical protein
MEPTLLALAMTSLKTNVRYSFVFFDWGRSVSVMQRENEAPVDSGVLERQTRQVLTHEGVQRPCEIRTAVRFWSE